MQDRPYIVGICGGSASGKTYFLEQILQTFPQDKLSLISLDNYYKPREEQMRDEEGVINFDHPESLNLDRLVEDVEAILRGETLRMKEYTFNNPDIVPKELVIRPAPLLILEGIFVFYPPKLQPLIDLKIFVDAAEHIKLSRRIRRDLADRNYSVEDTLVNYVKYVAPMYHRYVEPTKGRCDIVIPNNDHMRVAIEVVKNHLRAVIG